MNVKDISLKAAIRKALAGSSSLQPVDTGVLVKGHQRSHVEAALQELYQAHEIYYCKIIRNGSARTVWWLTIQVAKTESYWSSARKKAKAAEAAI